MTGHTARFIHVLEFSKDTQNPKHKRFARDDGDDILDFIVSMSDA